MKTLLIMLITPLLFGAEVTLEVLGSGGPEIDGRASSAYLITVDEKASLLVDTGSGAMLRFEQSGARLETLDAILLTHLHIDHAVDLPAFVKAGYFSERSAPLPIVGPGGNRSFPDIGEYLTSLFGPDGAYRYMQDVLTPQSDSFELVPYEMSEKRTKMQLPSCEITAIPVHHGIVPALAFRIEIEGKTIVISGDTDGQDDVLQRVAMGADLFIAHHAIPEDAGDIAKALHMTPSTIGRIARDAKVRRIVLSHRMNRTKGREAQSLKLIRSSFKGEVLFAKDGMRLTL